jgi:hypothetical protein
VAAGRASGSAARRQLFLEVGVRVDRTVVQPDLEVHVHAGSAAEPDARPAATAAGADPMA